MIYHYKLNEFPQVISAYSVIRKTVWSVADPNHILIFIKNGSCRIKLLNEVYVLSAGDIIYIPANTQYIRTPFDDEFCEMYYIHFTLTEIHEEFENNKAVIKNLLKNNLNNVQFSANKSFVIIPPISKLKEYEQEIFETFSKITRFYRGIRALDIQSASFCLCYLLSVISNDYISNILSESTDEKHIEYPEALKKALSYIKDHRAQNITLDDLCRYSYVSKQMLIRHFKKYFGKSPINYITDYKIDRIKPLLTKYPNLSVKEICTEFGFEDQCYFSRIFKKRTGESPTEYRNRVNNFNEKKHLKKN